MKGKKYLISENKPMSTSSNQAPYGKDIFDAFNAIERVKSVFPELIGAYARRAFIVEQKGDIKKAEELRNRKAEIVIIYNQLQLSNNYAVMNKISDIYAKNFRDLIAIE